MAGLILMVGAIGGNDGISNRIDRDVRVGDVLNGSTIVEAQLDAPNVRQNVPDLAAVAWLLRSDMAAVGVVSNVPPGPLGVRDVLNQAVPATSRGSSEQVARSGGPPPSLEALACSPEWAWDCGWVVVTIGGWTPQCPTGESGWNPLAVGQSGERGLMQLHPIHEERFEARGWTFDDAFDPYRNLTIADEIYREQGPEPWSCGP